MVTNTGIVKGFPSEDQYNEDMQSVIMSLNPYDQLSEFNDSTLFVLFREAGVDIRKYQALADKLSAYLTSDGVQLRITGVKVPDDLYDEFFASDYEDEYELEEDADFDFLEDPEEELDFDFRDDFSDDPDDYPDVDEGYYEEDSLEDEGEDFDTSEVEEDDPNTQEVVEVEEEDIPDFEDDADEDF